MFYLFRPCSVQSLKSTITGEEDDAFVAQQELTPAPGDVNLVTVHRLVKLVAHP